MDIIKLKPAIKDYIWGGVEFKKLIDTPHDRIAELWVVSTHRDGEGGLLYSTKNANTCDNTKNINTCNKTLSQYLGQKDLGYLIKLIDANDNLSVQVHPSDEWAKYNENGQNGKTEMWYIISAKPNCGIYCGLKDNITKQELKKALDDGSVLELLKFFKVKAGDCFFIPAGTIHAIGHGVTIAEVQQNSNLTYRLYDYNRVLANGEHRELHIDKALSVANLTKYSSTNTENYSIKTIDCDNIELNNLSTTTNTDTTIKQLARCEYFTTYELALNNTNSCIAIDTTTLNIFSKAISLVVVRGQGTIVYGDQKTQLETKFGDSFFVDCINDSLELRGNLTVLLVV